MVLAVIQCFVQLIFFLNLGKTMGPRWKLAAFLFMLLIVIIVAGGSLWIMRDLDYRMTLSPEQMLKYMNKETGL
jgi:cytochrome o ubiquinol oxidase operon protein cyoD